MSADDGGYDYPYDIIQWRDWNGDLHDGVPSDPFEAMGVRYHIYDDRWEAEGGTGWEDYKWVFTDRRASWQDWDHLLGESQDMYGWGQ